MTKFLSVNKLQHNNLNGKLFNYFTHAFAA
jgi:hypothetical protein